MKNNQLPKKTKGFTLIEILSAVVISGALIAIALPAYQGYTTSVRRKAAIADILSIQQQLEQQYTINNGAYALPAGLAANGNCNTASANTSGDPPHYSIAIALANNNLSYTITATACSIQSDDDCGNLRTNSDGVRQVSGTNGTYSVDSQCF